MKKLLFLFFTLTISSFTYSQVTSFNNLPISRVLIFNISLRPTIESAITVPAGKLWYIQNLGYPDDRIQVRGLDGNSAILSVGAVLSEGTRIWKNYQTTSLNVIEYDFEAQTTSLNTNDIKLDNKMQLFPNPTNSRLSLNSEKDYNIEVFDLTGRKIMEAQGNNLDMSNLSKATYIVKTFDKASKETYSYKVIKN